METTNQNKTKEKNNIIEYKTEEIQQILDILDSISLSGFVNHQKMITVLSIINKPFNKRQYIENKIDKNEDDNLEIIKVE